MADDPTAARRLHTSCGDHHALTETRPDGRLILASDIEIYTSLSANARPSTNELKAGDEEANKYRLELLNQIAAGARLELVVKRALVYKQATHRGKMRNRNSLRFAGQADALAKLAPTWKNQPFLVDHNTYEQSARKGTILTSELGEYKGSPAFYMGFSVVKTDAVQSVLDGTLDRFSIGWFPGELVTCTVHDVNVRGKNGCMCWPGDEVDYKGETRVVEFEFSEAEGKELSGVNVPAVQSTKIEDYRAALTAELGLPRRVSVQVPSITEEKSMKFARLAAALALTAFDETSEEAALAAVNTLRTRQATAEQELGVARAELASAQAQLIAARAAVSAAGASRLESILADGIRQGKIPTARDAAGNPQQSAMEKRFRRMGLQAGGIADVEAELAELPSIVPTLAAGAPQSTMVASPTSAAALATAPVAGLASGTPTIEHVTTRDPVLAAALVDFAKQSGQKVEDMISFMGTI